MANEIPNVVAATCCVVIEFGGGSYRAKAVTSSGIKALRLLGSGIIEVDLMQPMAIEDQCAIATSTGFDGDVRYYASIDRDNSNENTIRVLTSDDTGVGQFSGFNLAVLTSGTPAGEIVSNSYVVP